MLSIIRRATLVAVVVVAAVLSSQALTASAAFPQPAWNGDGDDVARCTSQSGGPQNLSAAFVFFATTGPGAVVNGNYISFTCNFKFTRNGSGYTSGVSVIVDYCGGAAAGDTRQTGTYNTDSGTFSVRLQRKVLYQGALITITLFTNNHGGLDDFNLQEMTGGSQNLSDLNRPQGAVPCPGGGTTQGVGAWSGTVTLNVNDSEVDAGDVVTFTATASPTINGTPYMIVIQRTDAVSGPSCVVSPCVKLDTYDFGVSYSYVAKVLKQDGTDLRATSAIVKVTWKATEDWDGTVGIRLAGGVGIVRPGTYVAIEAYAAPSLDNTDFVLRIQEQVAGGGGESKTCDGVLFQRCALAVVSQSETTRFFSASVIRRDGSGSPKAVSSSVVTVTWQPFATPFPCNDGWVVRDVTGTATVLIGDTVKVPIKKGDWICPRDMVETGAGSQILGEYEERGLFNPDAGPEFGRAAKVTVGPLTQLTLNFFGQGTDSLRTNLETGTVDFSVNTIAKSDFRIKSPTGTASVRGTEFRVTVEPVTGKTKVETFHGEVLVTPDNTALNPVTLYGGDQVTVESSKISPVVKLFGTLSNKRRLPAVTRDGPN